MRNTYPVATAVAISVLVVLSLFDASLHRRDFLPPVSLQLTHINGHSETTLMQAATRPVAVHVSLVPRSEARSSANLSYYGSGNEILDVPSTLSRYDVPWLMLPRVYTKTLEEAQGRVLFSTLKVHMSDGIGHAFTVLNAEVTTALTLGLAYTHRVGFYGSLSEYDHDLVENLFGWGASELPRSYLEREVCVVQEVSHKKKAMPDEKCPICASIQKNSSLPISSIVEVPESMTYGCTSCRAARTAAKDFLKRHRKKNTLFQMAPRRCDLVPKAPDFTQSYNYFYWKYWDAHSSLPFPSVHREANSMRKLPLPKKRNPLNFEEHELTIAIHARRGDFLERRNRRGLVSSHVFASVVRQVSRKVRGIQSLFAKMPVAVLVYSEGRRMTGVSGGLHDMHLMDRKYVDSDGSVRDARWFHRLITPGKSRAVGNDSATALEITSEFPTGVRVELRISTPISESVHEMASADVFIGSMSDMSQYAIRTVSRAGLQLLPTYFGQLGGCCTVRFDPLSGRIYKGDRVDRYWRKYAQSNEGSVMRALRQRLR